MSDQFSHHITKALRSHALAFPETSEGQSCVKRAFKARTKNFMFLGEDGDSCNVMLKLGPSLTAARTLAVDEPDRYQVGTTNWRSEEHTSELQSH